ncbi:ATP-binding protein [Arcticibacter eurypsychrophilus]|uniref:ATP-binding protein n=1 Tax=Arcticibacter eurypsychrophilus TaxID=1434752 RepID=UPI00084D0E80|nr:ATP-binding protein [Arcticibacter eurypsychrophilus]
MDLTSFDLSLIRKPPSDLVLETNVLRTITENCQDALEYHRMIAFIGDSGYGKTKSLQYFAAKKKNVYYLVVEKSMTSKRFYVELLNVLGFTNSFRGSDLNNLIKSISFHLCHSKQSNLLIIDEAGKFNANQLLFLHELRDNTKSNTGIILSGPPYFNKNMDLWKLAGKEGIPELYRRIQSWIPLPEPSMKEKKAYCSEFGILNDLADELADESKDFGTLDNKILEVRIAVIKYLKATEKKTNK